MSCYSYTMIHEDQQKGNVLVIILIAVALFAALSFVVSNMMRGGSASIGREKSGIYASEILTYAQSLSAAVRMMRVSNGCEDTDISFESNILTGYQHSPVATDGCKIFNASGGGLSYIRPNLDANDGLDWIFTGSNDGYDIGTQCNSDSCADLIAVLPNISLEICTEINKRLGISHANNYMTQEDDSFAVVKFQGTYSYSARLEDNAGLGALNGQYSGCFEGNSSPQSAGTYYFYQVLLAR